MAVEEPPRQALDRYYRGCVGRATVTNGPYDGQKEDTRYAIFSRVVEFTVDRRGMTRFLLVGKEHPDDEWAVLDGEGSGP